MLRRVALVRTDKSEERIAYIIRVKGISELGTTLAVTGVLQLLVTANVPSSLILFTPMMESVRSSETSVLTRATRRNIQEGGILEKKIILWVLTGSETKIGCAGEGSGNFLGWT
jgi:hypothetical protein